MKPDSKYDKAKKRDKWHWHLVMTFSVASWRFLHDNNDEDDRHSPEYGGTPEGPMPVMKDVGKSTTDNVTQATESVSD